MAPGREWMTRRPSSGAGIEPRLFICWEAVAREFTIDVQSSPFFGGL